MAKSFSVEYKALAEQLAKELALTIRISKETSLDQFKRRLSQAKYHSGIEGRLSFSETLVEDGWKISIVLTPSAAKTISILSIETKEGL